MKKNNTTIYAPISSIVQTNNGDEHIISWNDIAVSQETYEHRQIEHAEKINNIISPVLNDLYDLKKEILNDDFDCHIDGTEVIITHRYCPTLNKSECHITRKEYKSFTYNQKLEAAKDELIKHINSEIALREEAKDELIGNFVYHPLHVSIDELRKMLKDAESEINDQDLGPLVEETTEGIVLTDEFDDPVDSMDR